MPIWICKDDKSSGGSGKAANKFWGYEKQGNNVLVKWGRVGLAGQSKTHNLGSKSEQDRFIAKKTREKERKGYALSDEKEQKKEAKIAGLLGHQNKIGRMEFVDKKGKKLRRIANYDPKRYVYVEVMNSWKKTVTRLLLSKDESHEIIGVAEADRVIEYVEIRTPNMSFVRGVREALKELARKVAEVAVKFAAVGVRKLSLGDDEDEDDDYVPVMSNILEAMGDTAASTQVITKFAALGSRVLEL